MPIKMVPADAWKPGIAQDGSTEEDKDVAEVTHLMSRAGNWPDGVRWAVRRVKPSCRQMKNLTDYEKTGWRYSITCTIISDSGIEGVPGSHHPQYIDVAHREHAVAGTGGVRTAKAMGLRGLSSKSWQVNCGWVIAANIAARLAHHARQRILKISPADPGSCLPHLRAAALRPASSRLTSTNWPSRTRRTTPAR